MKHFRFILLLCISTLAQAQQYPFWTQYRSNFFMMNPAVAGTREDIDFRMSYRNQWVGFTGAPKTMGASLHAKLYKGKMGVGGYIFQDKIGVFSYTSAALAYSFKIKFDDVSLSLGANGSYNTMGINGGLLVYQNSQDMAMANVIATQKAHAFNAAAGALLYNDRFHIGFSMNNLAGTTYTYDKTMEIVKRGIYKTVPHFCASVGYKWSENKNFIWESNLMAVFVSGTPILVDYYLRLHIKQAFFVGGGIRLGVAVEGQLGYTFPEWGQISYSYDYNTNGLSGTNGGSHEIKLAFYYSKKKLTHGRGLGEFKNQKYQYML
ncbi:MAG TPA: type IX secretion system membrane protein PorP/SprF [Bacteroidia bacterium]|nr:type IX secretion system membrane protein PorP/SprF [Bacteroidia bacterium]